MNGIYSLSYYTNNSLSKSAKRKFDETGWTDEIRRIANRMSFPSVKINSREFKEYEYNEV